MSAKPIKNVLVLGATGSVGPAIVRALEEHPQGYHVSILTRPSSLERTRSMFPRQMTIHVADYSSPSVTPDAFKLAFQDQDAIVSATATFTVSQQIAIIDAAIASGTVQRFIPSEFGVDSSDKDICRKYLPTVLLKTSVIDYLKQHESKISWSAIITGAFFDWSFSVPGVFGWNVPARKVTIFDGGNVDYEATNMAQIARAVANTLSATASPGFTDGSGQGRPMFELTRNKYVYVNSFTTTQNEVLGLLEAEADRKFDVTSARAEEVGKDGIARAKKSSEGFSPKANSDYADGVTESITAAIYGHGTLGQYSKYKALWNTALALPTEDLADTIKRVFPSAAGSD